MPCEGLDNAKILWHSCMLASTSWFSSGRVVSSTSICSSPMVPWVLPFLARGFGAWWSGHAPCTDNSRPTLQSLNGFFVFQVGTSTFKKCTNSQ